MAPLQQVLKKAQTAPKVTEMLVLLPEAERMVPVRLSEASYA